MNERWKLLTCLSLVALLVTAAPFVASAETRAGTSISLGPAANSTPDGTVTRSPNESVTLTVWANATNVSGYQSSITFDPDVVRVTDVSGTDEFDAPVANLDNENGSVTFNQVRSGEATDPRLAEITVETVGTDGQQSELSFDASETKFSNETGGTFAPEELRSLTLSVESTTPTPTETTTATATPTETATATETPTSTPDTGSNAGGDDDSSGDSSSDAGRSGGGGGGGGGSDPPSFQISSTGISQTAATVGEQVTVQADVRNQGGNGTYTVQFAVNETSIEALEIDIESGETRTVTFTRRLSNPGTYEFRINSRVVGTTNVTAMTSTPTSTAQTTDTETTTATDLLTSAGTAADPASATTEPRAESPGTTTESREAVGQSVPGFGVTAALTAFVLLGGGLLIRRRQT